MKKTSLRSGLMATTTLLSSLAVTALVAGVATMPTTALAQSSVGSVYGSATAGSVVTLTDADTGITKTMTTGSDGQFVFNALPPGTYKVSDTAGHTETVQVVAGNGTTVTFVSDVVVVHGQRNTNRIDVKSVESTSIFTAAQLNNLPVSRDIQSVALLAPGTAANGSPANFGNAPSIGGSSAAENGYYINGFDVTNERTLLSFADLPFDAVEQEQVKTGGYGAEYGRSLGGVMSVVTKRGTNTWKFGGSVSWGPSDLKTHGLDVASKDPADAPVYDSNGLLVSDSHLYGYRSANTSSSFTYTEYAGGPLIEDKLFIFAAIEGKANQSDTFGRISSEHTSSNSPNGLLKLDWYITPNHHLEYTAIYNKDKVSYVDYTNDTYDDVNGVSGSFYSGHHENKTAQYSITNGGHVNILKYTGHLTDSFTLSVMGGYLENANANQDPILVDPAAAKCVRAYDSRTNTATADYIGCYNLSQVLIPDPNASPEKDTRKALRVDAEWNLGKHDIRFGYDSEVFSSTKRGEVYTGGAYWRHYYVYNAAGRKVNGVQLPFGTSYARRWVYTTGSSAYDVDNSAFYIEDSWQIFPRWIVYGGLRSESFTNKNGDGVPFVHADNSIAPRLGFSWDVNGDASLKISGTAGRYYIPVTSNTNIRASGVEATVEDYFYTTGVDTATGLPTGLGAQIGGTNVNGTLTPPDPNSVANANLEPMYQDEFTLTAAKKFSDSLTLGTSMIYRVVKNGMDDHCTYQPYLSWADDNGYGNTIDLGSIAPCVIINPGKPVTLSFDANGDGTPELHTVDAKYYGMPPYKRDYFAWELFGHWSGPKWDLQGSYTLSFSHGNVEGYVNTSLGQIDAGATQDFDNFKFEQGADGYLPNDHRHAFKAFGNYRFTNELMVSGSMTIQSGRPLNCFGFVDTSDPAIGIDSDQLALYSASSFYCMSSDGTVSLAPRGSKGRTDWTYNFNTSIIYTPEWAGKHITFKADIFNLFNAQTPTALNEVSEKGSASAFQYSPNYLLPSQYQSPRSMMLRVLYNF